MAHQSDMIAQDIERYLKEHENKELLRFITCGSVDDGKSTLIGRLLHDSKMIFEDQLAAIEQDSKKVGTQGAQIDLALLVDGLQSEREQGITIDVAYRFFSTEKRKFIIADTPGHEQYTRNMATGASTADLAIILIDARHGVQVQTRRHSFIVSLLGIKNVIVAINKMDLVDYDQARFEQIRGDYLAFARGLGIEAPRCVPISALNGDNVVNPGETMPWYEGEALMELLDRVEIVRDTDARAFRFPVQYVNRPNLNFRGFCGTIAAGSVSVGDEITVLPSRKTTRIASIVPPAAADMREPLGAVRTIRTAFAPMSVTLTTEDEIDIGRGDMIVHSDAIPEVGDAIDAMIVWMHETPMHFGSEYIVKRATSAIGAHFECVEYQVDVNTMEHKEADTLELNAIARCRLALTREIALDPYERIQGTGSFIVIDRLTNATVAAGMILGAAAASGRGREYSEAEKALNAYVREHFPEWECKAI